MLWLLPLALYSWNVIHPHASRFKNALLIFNVSWWTRHDKYLMVFFCTFLNSSVIPETRWLKWYQLDTLPDKIYWINVIHKIIDGVYSQVLKASEYRMRGLWFKSSLTSLSVCLLVVQLLLVHCKTTASCSLYWPIVGFTILQ